MNQLPRILAQQGLFAAARAAKRTNGVGMVWGTFSSQGGLCLAGRAPAPRKGNATHGVLTHMMSLQTAAMRADQHLDQAVVLALRSKFGGFSFENGVYRRVEFGLEAARIRNNTKIEKKMREGREMLSDVKTEMVPGHHGLMTKFRSVVAEYGKVAVAFHVSGVALTTSACYAALHMGLDVNSLVHMLPAAVSSHISEEMGTLALALLLCEMTAPPRYALTIVAAPKIAERIRGTRYGMIMGLRPKRSRKLSMSYLPGRSPRATSQP
jgi:hypothetical protein